MICMNRIINNITITVTSQYNITSMISCMKIMYYQPAYYLTIGRCRVQGFTLISGLFPAKEKGFPRLFTDCSPCRERAAEALSSYFLS